MQLNTLPETPAQAMPALETTEGKQEDMLACPLDLGYQSLRCHCTNPKTMNHNGSLSNSDARHHCTLVGDFGLESESGAIHDNAGSNQKTERFKCAGLPSHSTSRKMKRAISDASYISILSLHATYTKPSTHHARILQSDVGSEVLRAVSYTHLTLPTILLV